ncbi:MAG: polyphosphate kinase 1 [Planctomycetes bacterium]|nr:polyphosphate kinase 1 [Planctomycetota bacterium]
MNAPTEKQLVFEPGDAGLYTNREFSLMEFNRRVLAMAADETVPLLERLRFLTISCSNMDEFFEVRVSGVKQQAAAGVELTGPDEVRPQDILARIHNVSREIVAEQYRVFNEVLLPKLASSGIRILRRTEWNPAQSAWAEDYFKREVQPLLTPIGLDPSHPFPNVLNKILNFVVVMEGPDAFQRDSGVSIVQAPRVLPRVIRLPREVSSGAHDFVLLSAVIHHNIGELFPRMDVKGAYQFRVTRNSDLFVDEEEIEDLAEALRFELPRRHYGEAVRLEVADNCPMDIANMLLDHFHLTSEDLYQVNGPVNLNRLVSLYDLADTAENKYPPYLSGKPKDLAAGVDMFDVLKHRDMLLHHPYQSFGPVLEFIRKAATDPSVVAIMGTLYRTGAASEVTEALHDAARAGKEVTACIELRARFDEAANIDLATRLQNAGAQVVYGVVGYKTHAKMMLLLRREDGKLKRYVHMGTGNYHTGTARAYTDLSLLTSNEDICADVHKLFRELTSPGDTPGMKQIYHSPFTLNDMVIQRIKDQTDLAQAGQPSGIRAKMNSLSDPGVIKALYAASMAGVPIDLIIRGVCCLRPGVPGVSDNIRVRSIIGRFLEHSRVYGFGPEDEFVYASSADWMQRNLHRRVEACFPVLDPALKARVVRECLDIPLSDNVQAWLLQSDGTWVRCQPGDSERRAAQEVLAAELGGTGGQV